MDAFTSCRGGRAEAISWRSLSTDGVQRFPTSEHSKVIWGCFRRVRRMFLYKIGSRSYASGEEREILVVADWPAGQAISRCSLGSNRVGYRLAVKMSDIIFSIGHCNLFVARFLSVLFQQYEQQIEMQST